MNTLEMREYGAEDPDMQIFASRLELLQLDYPQYIETRKPYQLPANHYFVSLLGDLAPTLTAEEFGDRSKKWALRYRFCHDVDVTLIVKDFNLVGNEKSGYVEAEDMYFTANSTEKTILVPPTADIWILSKHLDLMNRSVAGFSVGRDMRINIPGNIRSDFDSSSDKRMHDYHRFYKSIEPIIIFHEIAHPLQAPQLTMEEEGIKYGDARVFRERDAFRYGVQAIHYLRANGIDLLPGMDVRQMYSRIEYFFLTLPAYDKHYYRRLNRRFSTNLQAITGSGFRDPLTQWFGVRRALKRLQRLDPTL